ncbi:hypothetical protein K1T71_003233 [Dendrolimus kikuchii]|uniref:Uncharacterized protein n=1 Tax=Dendrolimus kikuchii TaxID=765133 RepID=A0ACC1DB17_9NEOP|nr:hypothetical protein K1T71_003233 [Dendrolimus kikuchii]
MARGIFKLYQEALSRRPYLVQAIQTGTLMGAGDLISQSFIERKLFSQVDFARTLKFSSIGFFVGGPALRVWYGMLYKHIGSTGKMVTIKKILSKETFMMDTLQLVSSNKIFGGDQKVYSHESTELKCKMNFSIYLPPQVEGGDVKLPVIFYLSGLTCTEQNFITKSGFQRYASEHGIIVVGPDTSPRGIKIAGDDESWDFGVSAGFYLDAAKEPWSTNYRMGSYLNKELYELILKAFNNIVDPDRVGIMGHSMGGHGALVSTLRNPGLYKSVSAFAPICNPTACPWGVKAFTGYLGEDKSKWVEWDATELVKKYDGPPLTLLLDQGAADKFYIEKQLLPENLVEACRSVEVPVILNLRDGYDHSYYYISTYIGEHFDFHAKILKA